MPSRPAEEPTPQKRPPGVASLELVTRGLWNYRVAYAVHGRIAPFGAFGPVEPRHRGALDRQTRPPLPSWGALLHRLWVYPGTSEHSPQVDDLLLVDIVMSRGFERLSLRSQRHVYRPSCSPVTNGHPLEE